MAVTAAELAIIMRAQDQATSVMRQVGQQVQTLSRQISGLSGPFAAAAQSSSALELSLHRILRIASGVVLGRAIAETFQVGFDAASEAVIGFNAQLQKSQISWGGLLKNGEEAAALMNELRLLALRSPFEFPGLERSARILKGMGFSVSEIVPLMTRLGNAAAALSLGEEGIYRISLALSQMRTKTRVMAQEMNQLTEAGVPAWEILANAIKKPTGEIQKMVEEGQISAAVFQRAFEQFVDTEWGDMMTRQVNTFIGALNNLKDVFRFFGATMFKPVFDRLDQFAQKLADESIAGDQFMVLATQMSAGIEVIAQGLTFLVGVFADSFSSILTIVTSVGQAVYIAFQWINPFATHSPSLVSSVTKGVDEILKKYGSLDAIKDPLVRAGGYVEEFRIRSSDGLRRVQDQLLEIEAATLAIIGSSVPEAYKKAAEAVRELEVEIERLQGAIEAQEKVVNGLETQLDGVEEAINAKESSIRRLERAMSNYDRAVQTSSDRVSELRESLRLAEDELRRFARTPLQGTKAYSDELFAIEQQINAVKLQMAELRVSGAPASALKRLQKELDILEAKAERVRLSERIELDPLRRKIDELAEPMEEMSFEAIVAGLLKAREAQKQYASELARAEKILKDTEKARDAQRLAIEKERESLDLLRESRDQLRSRYEKEREKLRDLEDAQRDATKMVKEWSQGLKDAVSAAKELEAANKKAKGSTKDFSKEIENLRKQGVPVGLDEYRKQVEKLRETFRRTSEEINRRFGPALGVGRDAMLGFAGALRVLAGATSAAAAVLPGFLQSLQGKSIGELLWGLTTSLPDIWTQVTTWLGDQWSRIQWTEVWSKTTSGVGEGLVGRQPSIVGYIVQWLQNQWSQIDWNQVWAAARNIEVGLVGRDIVGSVTEWLTRQWNGVVWGEVWTKTTRGVGEGLVRSKVPIYDKIGEWLADQWSQVVMPDVWAMTTKGVGEGSFRRQYSVVEYFQSWFNKTWAGIDWSKVWAAVDPTEFLSGVAKQIVGSAATVTKYLTDEWININWDGVWGGPGNAVRIREGLRKSLTGMDKSLTEWLGEDFAKIRWGDVVGKAIEGLKKSLGNIATIMPAEEIGRALARVLTTVIGTFFDVLNALINELFTMFWDNVSGASERNQGSSFVARFIRGFLDPAVWGPFFSKYWLDLLSLLFTPAKFAGPLAKILARIPIVGTILAWFVKGLSTVGEKLGAQQVGSSLLRGLPTFLKNVLVGALDAIDPTIMNRIRYVDQFIIQPMIASLGTATSASSLGHGLGMLLINAAKGVIGLVSKDPVWGLVGTAIVGLIAKALGVKKEPQMIEDVLTGTWKLEEDQPKDLIEVLRRLFEKGLKGFAETVEKNMDTFAKPVKNTISRMIRELFNLEDTEEISLETILEKLFKPFSGKDGGPHKKFAKQIGKDISEGILQGMIEGVTDFVAGVQKWINDYIVGLFKKKLKAESPSLVMAEIGEDIVNGLVLGVYNKAAYMWGEITKWVDENVLTPVKNFLGIKSPSTEFTTIGENVADGLIKGLANKAVELWEAGVNTGKNLMRAVAAGLGEVQIPLPKFSLGIEEVWSDLLQRNVPMPKINMGIEARSLRELFPEVFKAIGLAEGGIVRQEGLYRLAEGNKAEAVVPLGRGGFGNTYNLYVTVQGSVITERDLVRTLRDELIRINGRNAQLGIAM